MIHSVRFFESTMFAENSGDDLGHNGFSISLNYFSGLPDVSCLHNSNLVVVFKSLMKKDSITKEKSLLDFFNIIDAELVKDESLVTCWLQMYPKLAMDNSRNVRTLTHQIQAALLHATGGKVFAKYLKSSLPIWLMGIYDPDKSVANAAFKGLLESFQSDKDRVNVKIWSIFKDQILAFIEMVVCQESPGSLSDARYTKEDDSQSKYERVLCASLSMLVKVISLTDAGELKLEAASNALVNSLNLEKLWDYLGSSLDKKTMNLLLFKALLALLKSTFSACGPFVTEVPDLKNLYKLTSKKFIKHVKLSQKSSIVYSSFILQFWDTLVCMTKFPSESSLKVRKNFWELGGSKARSRLIDYLRVGNCGLDPIYYTILGAFFAAYAKVDLKDSEVNSVNLSDAKDAELVVLDILAAQFQTLPDRFKPTCLTCIWRVVALCPPEARLLVISSALQYVAACFSKGHYDPFELPVEIREDVASALAQVAHYTLQHLTEGRTESTVLGTKMYKLVDFVPNYTSLLACAVKARVIDENIASDFVQKVIECLNDENVDDHLAFEIIAKSTKEVSMLSDSNLKRAVTVFIAGSPSFVEPDFMDIPIDYLLYVANSESPLFSGLEVSAAINDSFVKISMTDKTKAPVVLAKVQKLCLELSEFPDIYEYVHQLTKRSDLSQEERSAMHGTLNDLSVLKSLLSNSKFDDGTCSAFIEKSNGTDLAPLFKSIEVSEENKENLTRVMLYAWKTTSSALSQSFLSAATNSGLREICLDTFFVALEEADVKSLADSIASFASESTVGFILDKILADFETAASKVNIATLSMGNILQQNSLLFVDTAENGTFNLDDKLLAYSRFIELLMRLVKTPFVMKLGLFLAEYVQDYFFLTSNSKPSLTVEETNQSICDLALDSIAVTLESIVDLLNTDDSQHPILLDLWGILESDKPRSTKFYAARSLCVLFQKNLDGLAIPDFENTPEIQFNKILRKPYKAAVVLISFKEFLHLSKKFERVKNVVMSEILGVKPARAATDGVVWLALSCNFLDSDADIAPGVIPLHRLTMIMGQLSSWLDSDMAYDWLFVSVRCLIARFISGLVSIERSVPDKLYELAGSVVSDNIDLAAVDAHLLHLRYFSLKLIKAIGGVLPSEFHVEVPLLSNIVLDLFLNPEVRSFDESHRNVPLELCQEQCFQILSRSNVSPKEVDQRVESLEELFTKSTTIKTQRLAAQLLLSYILRTQADFVVEHQLLKANISDENNSKAKIPQYLIEAVTVNEPVSLIDDVSPSDAARYLWSWLLIFDHFRDITYSIRNDYVSQMRDSKLVETLLDSIFLTVDVASSRIAKVLVVDEDVKKQKVDPSKNLISKYSVVVGHGDSAREEIEFLVLHLYYLCFVFIGSYIQNWYNAIRDRLLKQSVDKFSIKYVSPLVIERILDQVAASKDSLAKDENTTVKVNAVTNEIKTVFNIDEQTMEMVIKVPESYPLSLVQVNGPLRLGVKENQWKAWLLASQRIISLVNGSITEAIELFIKNVDLHFSGFEECAICYSILHQDHSLPSKVCTTCLNKFHSACLYKWFKSSGASTCPLCRSAFNFRRQAA